MNKNEEKNKEIERLYNSKLKNFYEDVSNSTDCVTDKTFGPFIPYSFKDYFTAIKNDYDSWSTDYGMGTSKNCYC
jgi:hypothetical protein